jgi:hypothetical protein
LNRDYAIGDEEKTWLLSFPKGQTVGDFIELMNQKQRTTNFLTAILDGGLLDNGDLVGDWFRLGAVFRAAEDFTTNRLKHRATSRVANQGANISGSISKRTEK